MARYVLTAEAQADIRRLDDYLDFEGGPQLSRHVISRIIRAFRLLAERPQIGHTRPDLTLRPVKFWAVFSYLIIYDPASRPLAIVRVLRGSRDVEAILEGRLPQER